MWTLIQDLDWTKGKKANTDSRYVFATVNVHGMLYKEYGLSQLMIVIWKPKKIIMIHCEEYQKVKDTVTLGNHKADEAAKLATKGSTQGTNGLIQNLEAQHEIPPKTVLNHVCGSLHNSKEETK